MSLTPGGNDQGVSCVRRGMPEFRELDRRLVADLSDALWWAPEWVTTATVFAVFLGLGWLAHKLIFAGAKRTVRKRDLFWRGLVSRARLKTRIIVLLAATAMAASASSLSAETASTIHGVVLFISVLAVGWLVSGALDVWTTLYLRRFNVETEDNLVARKHLTQTRILQKVGRLLVAIVTLGLALMTIGGFRQWGVSLLASAGVVGIIAGLALQPVLTNLLAGIQIAITQPIRIDDAVIVEGEWGNVEEITSTYVVVRLWDWRRMILPLSYFITTPFQNWTRETARLIGSVFLYVDPAAPVERLRAAFESIVRASPHWDGDVQVLQVVETTERMAQVRCLASARNGGTAFDLRCEIREKMLAFMRDHCPEALPRDRLELERPPAAT